MHILVINSGSSSIKFSIFDAGEGPGNGVRPPWPSILFAGEISGIGAARLGFTFRDAQGRELAADDTPGKDPVSLLEADDLPSGNAGDRRRWLPGGASWGTAA